MARSFSRTLRSAETRRRLLAIGRQHLEAGGFSALSMRRVAAAAQLTQGAIQCHFRTHGDFSRHVIETWAEDVTGLLDQDAGTLRGLRRAATVCQSWLSFTRACALVFEGSWALAKDDGYNGARAAFLKALRDWIELTHRTLQQARVLKELQPAVDLHRAAVHLHRIVWSHGWMCSLYGLEESARATLTAVWDHLSSIAQDPARSLPDREAFIAWRPDREDAAAPPARPPAAAEAEVSRWSLPVYRRLLAPGDPRFHAFERLQLLGDPSDYPDEIDVLPEDVAAADEYRRIHGDGTEQR